MASTQMDIPERLKLLPKIFTPRTPVSERDLFAGRISQLETVFNVIEERGAHGVIFGERGVGKTSLANVIATFSQTDGTPIIMLKATCDSSDDFSSLWRKAFKGVNWSEKVRGIGFNAVETEKTVSLLSKLPDNLDSDRVLEVFLTFSKGVYFSVIFDEFDRVESDVTVKSIADLVKTLSDNSSTATIIVVGVADSVDELIRSHASTERAFVQIPMPRMSTDEIREIIKNGIRRLEMTIIDEAEDYIVSLSQGLPYITHLLSLHSFQVTLESGSTEVETSHVKSGVEKALAQWQASIKAAYVNAVSSVQPQHIFREVLLACALCETDELGYFKAADVRTELRNLTKKAYDIPGFARHLKEFSSTNRGNIIERSGPPRRLRYRFNNPLMRPYIVLKAVSDGLISINAVGN